LNRSHARAAGLCLLLAACTPAARPAQPQIPLAPGTVELNQGPPKDKQTGGSGTGTLAFQGQLIRFDIGGLGVDGAAIAVLQTSGEVMHLADLANFPGVYHRAPGQSDAGLWLQNQHGTVLHLRPPPQGRMPDIGNDAVRIDLQE
jgi:hypothetical protein